MSGILCPTCSGPTEVLDGARRNLDGSVRRRRCCIACGGRFTTHETIREPQQTSVLQHRLQLILQHAAAIVRGDFDEDRILGHRPIVEPDQEIPLIGDSRPMPDGGGAS